MKRISLFVLCVLAHYSISAWPQKPYPYKDPWTSTLSYALVKPQTSSVTTFQEVPHRERDQISELVAANNYVQLNVFLSPDKKSPVICVLPGIGSNGDEKGAAFMAEKLFQKGFTVITFPSTFSSSFALAVSSTGVPGYVPEDAKDLYALMHRFINRLKKDYAIEPASYNILGYSLGARDAVFIQAIDLNQTTARFAFQNIYLINPPMSLPKGMEALDKYFQVGWQWSDNEKNHIMDQIMASYKKQLSREFREDDYYTLEDDYKIDNQALTLDQRQWLIGNSFHESLVSVFFSIEDLEVLDLSHFKTHTLGFRDYIHDIAYPFFTKQYGLSSIQELFSAIEFKPMAEKVRGTTHIGIVHNENDFLMVPTDTDWINSYSSDSKVYNYGGHLGSMWYPDNIEAMVRFFQPKANE